jgi:hypothetical protein
MTADATADATAGAAHGAPAPAPCPAAEIDALIVAIWHTLRANPDLDARCAMDTINWLLDRVGKCR